jgi:hypothetical protein
MQAESNIPVCDVLVSFEGQQVNYSGKMARFA